MLGQLDVHLWALLFPLQKPQAKRALLVWCCMPSGEGQCDQSVVVPLIFLWFSVSTIPGDANYSRFWHFHSELSCLWIVASCLSCEGNQSPGITCVASYGDIIPGLFKSNILFHLSLSLSLGLSFLFLTLYLLLPCPFLFLLLVYS